jgi:hypothetical protein
MNSGDAFDCQVCRMPYDWSVNPPVLLSRCGHSVCQSCAQKMIREKSSLCPCIGCPFRYDFCDSLTKNTTQIVPKTVSLFDIMGNRTDLFSAKKCPLHNEKCDIFCLDSKCEGKEPVCFKCLRDHHQLCDSSYFVSKTKFETSNVKNFELTPWIWLQELKNLAECHVNNYLSAFLVKVEEEIQAIARRHILKEEMTFDNLRTNFNNISVEIDPETKSFTFRSKSNAMLQTYYDQTKQSLFELFNIQNIPIIFSNDVCTSVSDYPAKYSVRSAPFEITKSFEFSHPRHRTSKRLTPEVSSPSSTQISIESDQRKKVYHIFSNPEIVRDFLCGQLNPLELLSRMPMGARFVLVNYCSIIPKNLIKIKQMYPEILCVNIFKASHRNLFNANMIRNSPLFLLISHNGRQLKTRHMLSSYRSLSFVLKNFHDHAFEEQGNQL